MQANALSTYCKASRVARQMTELKGGVVLAPIVILLTDDGKLVTIAITHCDWCGMPLLGDYKTEDDAVRPMYFCSDLCQAAFNAKHPRAVGTWPSVKLSLRGLFVRLKDL